MFRVSRRKEGRDVQDLDTEVVVMSWVRRAAGYGVVEFENRGSNGVGILDLQPTVAAIDHVFTNVGEAAHDGPRQLRGHESIDAAVTYQYESAARGRRLVRRGAVIIVGQCLGRGRNRRRRHPSSGKKPTSRRYSPEEKASAVRMVRTLRAELGTEHGTVQRVASFGIPASSFPGSGASSISRAVQFDAGTQLIAANW
jgi:hypothetical protein